MSPLRDDLTTWGKNLDGGDQAEVVHTLDQWKVDADLSRIRDEEALGKLPEDEREAFRSLWADAEALRQKATAGGK